MDELRATMLDALGTAFAVAPYVVVLVLALVTCIVSLMVWRSPVAGLVVVLVSIGAETLFPGFGLPIGVKVIVPDLASMILLLPVFFRLTSLWRNGAAHRLWIVFGAVMAGSMLYGAMAYGTKAGIEVRVHLHYWIVGTYFMTFPWRDAQALRMVKVFIAGAFVMVLLALYRWLGLAFGFGDVLDWNDAGNSLRVFNYNTTIGIGLALTLAIFGRGVGAGAGVGLLILPLAATVIVLQHRTAWAAVAVALAVAALSSGKLRDLQAKGMRRGLAGLVVVAVVIIALGQGDKLGDSLDHSVEEVGSERSTLSWRTQSWQELMKGWVHAGPRVWLVGSPYGAGFNRWIENWNREADVNPHSNYVYLILRVGIVGSAALLGSILLALRALARRRDDGWAVLLGAGLIMQLVGFFAYPSYYGIAFVVGMALSYLGRAGEGQGSRVAASEHSGAASWTT